LCFGFWIRAWGVYLIGHVPSGPSTHAHTHPAIPHAERRHEHWHEGGPHAHALGNYFGARILGLIFRVEGLGFRGEDEAGFEVIGL
jgi:hypothetical protein